MATNPYVNWISSTVEQDLVQSLTTEMIQGYGMPVVYLPRSCRREDVLYKEDILSQFTQVYEIEAYMNTPLGWTGQGSQVSKFGITTNDGTSLLIARDRFEEVFANASPEITRPMEGDLIYLPAPMDALFEIAFVEHEKAKSQFYQLGGLYFYELKLVLHVFNQETFATSNTTIDAFQTEQEFQESGTDSPNDPTDDNAYLEDEAFVVVDEREQPWQP